MSRKSAFFNSNLVGNTALNSKNLYIPYENHGFAIALLLDLELRDKDDLKLDDFMSLMWSKYGKTDKGYNDENVYATLREYAGDSFADSFYKTVINGNSNFEFKKPLESIGVNVSFVELPYMGAEIEFNKDEKEVLTRKIQLYFNQELNQQIGQFDAEFLLDFFTEEVGAFYYNRGLMDAQAVIQDRVETIADAIFELEKPALLNR